MSLKLDVPRTYVLPCPIFQTACSYRQDVSQTHILFTQINLWLRHVVSENSLWNAEQSHWWRLLKIWSLYVVPKFRVSNLMRVADLKAKRCTIYFSNSLVKLSTNLMCAESCACCSMIFASPKCEAGSDHVLPLVSRSVHEIHRGGFFYTNCSKVWPSRYVHLSLVSISESLDSGAAPKVDHFGTMWAASCLQWTLCLSSPFSFCRSHFKYSSLPQSNSEYGIFLPLDPELPQPLHCLSPLQNCITTKSCLDGGLSCLNTLFRSSDL
jgi:hypothetical protein